MAFTVMHETGDPPKFQVCQDQSNEKVFCPDQQTILLAKNESGVICIDATATGYPNPQYYWEYFVDGVHHEVEDDPCLQSPHSDGDKYTGKKSNAAARICIIPSLHNARDQYRTYQCTVKNAIDEITGHTAIKLDLRDWLFHDHPNMSKGVIYLSNGTATGEVAVYDDCDVQKDPCVTYLICFVGKGETSEQSEQNLEDLVCKLSNPPSIHRSSILSTCCDCGASDCTKGYTSHMADGDKVTTSSLCSFSTSQEGDFFFFGTRSIKDPDMESPVYQYFGKVSVETKPIVMTPTIFIPSIVGAYLAGVVTVVVLFATCCCFKKLICCCREEYQKRQRHRGYEVIQGQQENVLFNCCRRRREGLIPVVKLVTRDAGQEEPVEWNVPQENIVEQDGKFCIDLGNLEGVPNPFPPILEVTVADVTTAVTMLRNIAGWVRPRCTVGRLPNGPSESLQVEQDRNLPRESITEDGEGFVIDLGILARTPPSTRQSLKMCFDGKIITVLMTLPEAVAELNLSNSWEMGQAILQNVEPLRQQLGENLNVDATLLAGMKQRKMLSTLDFDELQNMLDKKSRTFIANHFLNNIFFRWAPNIFKGQLRNFVEELSCHTDASNQAFAKKFLQILNEFQTPPQSMDPRPSGGD
jgi:hypothetical protein